MNIARQMIKYWIRGLEVPNSQSFIYPYYLFSTYKPCHVFVVCLIWDIETETYTLLGTLHIA